MGKGGPRSTRGKARVGRNAITHGAFTAAPVIQGLEQARDWHAHCRGVLASLSPEGQLEYVLAQRAALLLWRLGRVARYEHEMITLQQEEVIDGIVLERRSSLTLGTLATFAVHPDDVAADYQLNQETAEALEQLPIWPDAQAVSGDIASSILWAVARTAEVDLDDADLPGIPPDLHSDDYPEWAGWTAGIVRRGVQRIAAQAGTHPDALLPAALDATRMQVIRTRCEAERVEKRLSDYRCRALLPEPDTLDKVMRYEAHLSRQLWSTLHELEALQARRKGQITPLARVDVSSDG